MPVPSEVEVTTPDDLRRLRHWLNPAQVYANVPVKEFDAALRGAADRIERLEAALKQLDDGHRHTRHDGRCAYCRRSWPCPTARARVLLPEEGRDRDE